MKSFRMVSLILPFAAVATLGAVEESDVAELFSENCQHCHTVPDSKQPLDLAWLDQVNRTA